MGEVGGLGLASEDRSSSTIYKWYCVSCTIGAYASLSASIPLHDVESVHPSDEITRWKNFPTSLNS